MDKVINEEYKIIRSIGKGHSSEVYEAISIKNGKKFAVKLQKSQKSDSIMREATILMNLQQKNNLILDYGLPFCYLAGTIDTQNYQVIDLYSYNLKSMLKHCSGMFKINTFLMVADQTLRRLEFLHNNSYIHRSISLHKFLIGIGHNNTKIYLNGLGNGKKYMHGNVHIPYKEGRKSKGNLMYKSINTHLGLQASRRDDLQSLIYCWAYMLYGHLPWQKEQDQQKILSKKVQNRGQVLFANFPKQLQQICDYARNLNFNQTIDYEKLRTNIFQLFEIYKMQYNYEFDWLQQKLKSKLFKQTQ